MKSSIEESFAQHLADNEKTVRDKSVKKLRNYIRSYSQEDKNDINYIKLWKGLYYCMYMADKPLVQEDVAEKISMLIHVCHGTTEKILFFKAGMETFAREWDGIDVFRMNKFMMLFTRTFRQMLVHLRRISWKEEEVAATVEILESKIICPSDNINMTPLGLKMHLTEVIMEELAKIGREQLPHYAILGFLYPFLKVLLLSNIVIYRQKVKTRIINWLIDQSNADSGAAETVKEDKQQLDDTENDSFDEDADLLEEPLDPRAGGVDVVLPQLKPDYDKLADVFLNLGSIEAVGPKKRKEFYGIVRRLRFLTKGVDPTPIKGLPPYRNEVKKYKKKSGQRLMNFEEVLMEDAEMGRAKGTKRKLVEVDPKRPKKKLSLEDVRCPKSPTPTVVAKRKKPKRKLKPKKKVQKIKIITPKIDLETEIIDKISHIAERVSFPKLICNGELEVKKTKKNDKKKFKRNVVEEETELKSSENNIPKEKKKKRKKKPSKPANLVPNNTTAKLKSKPKFNKKGVPRPTPILKKKADPWKEPLKEGELEIVITKKSKQKPTSKQLLNVVATSAPKRSPNSKGRTLKINLKRNVEHDLKDYKETLNKNPGVPFTSTKKPKGSVLKSPNGTFHRKSPKGTVLKSPKGTSLQKSPKAPQKHSVAPTQAKKKKIR